MEEVLVKLLGRSGTDLEKGVEGQVTLIKSKKIKKRLKVAPE